MVETKLMRAVRLSRNSVVVDRETKIGELKKKKKKKLKCSNS